MRCPAMTGSGGGGTEASVHCWEPSFSCGAGRGVHPTGPAVVPWSARRHRALPQVPAHGGCLAPAERSGPIGDALFCRAAAADRVPSDVLVHPAAVPRSLSPLIGSPCSVVDHPIRGRGRVGTKLSVIGSML